MSGQKQPILPPTYFFASLLLEAALHFGFPIIGIIAYPWSLAGLFPIAIGVVVSAVGSKTFERHETTIKPFQQSSTLVVDGLFRHSRNPMYLAMVVILAGVAIVLGSLSPWIVAIMFPFVITRRFILAEEAMLFQTFGEQYEAYRRAVRRWI